jgi:mannan endo-1,4-beta-mannosidase
VTVLAGAPFALGVNLPWIRYGCDFGANAWQPHGGLGVSGAPPAVTAALDRLGRRDVRVIRWFLLCDGRAGIAFGDDDEPRGPDACLFRDIDAALDLATRAGLSVVFSLVDFLLCHRARDIRGVRIHGRRRILAYARGRAALIDRVLTPLLDRYARHPAVGAWEVINEPEWVTRGVGGWNPLTTIRRAAMRAFIADVSAVVHARTIHPVTVGSAHARWLNLVEGLGLDFYQVHWYDRSAGRLPLTRPVSAFDLDRPIVLGEFPSRGSAHAPEALLAQAREAGYAAAWPWSICAEDTATDGPRAVAALEAIGSRDKTERA